MRVGIYARVSTNDQQILPMQLEKMKEYRASRLDFNKGSRIRREKRPKREELVRMAKRREIDAILVWKLDRFGCSLADLVMTLNELCKIGVVFVSLTASLDFSTPSGRAMAGMLSTFAEFERDIIRVKRKDKIINRLSVFSDRLPPSYCITLKGKAYKQTLYHLELPT